MLVGEKAKIAFEFDGVENGLAQISIYLNNVNLTVRDNYHYYPVLVNGLRSELDALTNLDLTLKDSYKIYSLAELYDFLQDGIQVHYESNVLNCFTYDLATQSGSFYVYQHIDSLVFFGKLNGEFRLLYCVIDKISYRKMIETLLHELQNNNT